MKITVMAVGRLKEGYWRDAQEEYVRRLGAYAKVQVIEADDEKTPEGLSAEGVRRIQDREGERILARLPRDAYVIALAIGGKPWDSPGLSRHLDSLALTGHSHLAFVIGGSLGLSSGVLERADEQMSFSQLTFPHQMMRIILLEQVYRCMKISRNEPYHK